MNPVKLNLYISYTPDDLKAVEKLRDWLYPMRDEVNIWYNDPPKPPKPLPVPWQLIAAVLPVFNPRDLRKEYEKTDRRRKERAHIYLFMTSYKSLNDNRIEDDITLAVQRRIEGDMLSPHIYPVILAPSQWKERSRLSRFKPLGAKKSLAETKPEEEGYLEITQQLTKVIQEMQRDLNEAKYAQSRVTSGDAHMAALPSGAQPYLGGDEESLEFQAPAQINPPEWLGWLVIVFLFLSLARGLRGDMQEISLSSAPGPAQQTVQEEFRRQYPMRPPREEIPLRPAE